MKRRRGIGEFGELVSPEDVQLASGDGLPLVDQDSQQMADMSKNSLWEYMNTGKLNGIPVALEDRGLKIDNADMLQAVFQLERVPRSLLVYMSPDDEDGQKKYDEVMTRAYAGEVTLVDEQKQFDPAKGRFVVWLRYDEIWYALHPRFKYLREE